MHSNIQSYNTNNNNNVLNTSNTNPVSIGSNSYSNSNHLVSSSPVPQIVQSNNSTSTNSQSEVGKRILLSANSQSVNTSVCFTIIVCFLVMSILFLLCYRY